MMPRELSAEVFAGLVAEAMGLDQEGIEDAQNWPVENLLPLVHCMRIDAERWRWLLPKLRWYHGVNGSTVLEAWLPAFSSYSRDAWRDVTRRVDFYMAEERRDAVKECGAVASDD